MFYKDLLWFRSASVLVLDQTIVYFSDSFFFFFFISMADKTSKSKEPLNEVSIFVTSINHLVYLFCLLDSIGQ